MKNEIWKVIYGEWSFKNRRENLPRILLPLGGFTRQRLIYPPLLQTFANLSQPFPAGKLRQLSVPNRTASAPEIARFVPDCPALTSHNHRRILCNSDVFLPLRH